jgi:mRNA deadenylase 3'-5' endonuclease subunit Ccr4
MNKIVCAFDIERSGPTSKYDTIGIGLSIVDSTLQELDNLFLPGFFPESTSTPTLFEPKCYNEFWSTNLDQLHILEYKGISISKEERQKNMIIEFQHFRSKWEILAEQQQCEFLLVSDNNVYDGGFINDLIFKNLPNTLPIPYSAGNGNYEIFFETHSQQKGFLMAVDPQFDHNWGLTDRINELFEVPKKQKSHDHNPVNDAYTIAFDQQVMFAIRDGRIRRR